MERKAKKSDYLRREWKLNRDATTWKSNKNYVPSHEREGFDESKVIKLPPGE